MHSLLASISKFIVGILVSVGIISAPLGTGFNPGQAQRFTLAGSGITSSASSITISSFAYPDGTPITMSNLNSSVEYGTLEPGTSKEEQIPFTGVTQNVNGTAVLTGVSRGLSFYYPFAASTTLAMSHAGASTFVLSNTAAFYSEFAKNKTDESISGIWTFASTTIPRLDSYLAPTLDNELASKKYVDDIAISGSPDATTAVKGIVEIATDVETASSTPTGSTGATLVIPASNATSTYNSATAPLKVVVTDNSGKIDGNFLDTTESYNFTGNNNFTGNILIKNLNASSTASNPLILNNVSYNTPSTQGATSTTLQNDGSGNLTWAGYNRKLLVQNTTTCVTLNSTATSTVFALNVPGGSLSTNNAVRVRVSVASTTSMGTDQTNFDIGYGTASTTISVNATSGQTNGGYFDVILSANGATNSQKLSFLSSGVASYPNVAKFNILSQDSTTDKMLIMRMNTSVNTGESINCMQTIGELIQ